MVLSFYVCDEKLSQTTRGVVSKMHHYYMMSCSVMSCLLSRPDPGKVPDSPDVDVMKLLETTGHCL